MKQDVLDYLRYTPANTNVNVVSTMLGSDGGGELPEEVKNAILTHGMGWTSEEPVPAINITWDGNTEGRESFNDMFYKVSDNIFITKENIVGATVSFVNQFDTEESIIITEDNIIQDEEYPQYYVIQVEDYALIYVISENFLEYHKGIYFLAEDGVFASSLTKEASTQEVVHQIDEKYIPSSGGALDTIEVSAELSDDGIVATLVTPEDSIIENIDNIKFAEIDGILYGFVMNRQMRVAQEGVYQLLFSGVRVNFQPDSVNVFRLMVVIMDGEDTICDLSSITVYSEPEETD